MPPRKTQIAVKKPGRPSSPNPQRQRIIMCDSELWDRVVTEANRDGVSISEFVRVCLTGAVGVLPKRRRAA